MVDAFFLTFQRNDQQNPLALDSDKKAVFLPCCGDETARYSDRALFSGFDATANEGSDTPVYEKRIGLMKTIANQTYDEERALYGISNIHLLDCTFAGPADGESAVKEASDVFAEHCFFDLRYPFWHVHRLDIRECRMSEGCRAALWYSDHVAATGSELHGIKAFRECGDVAVRNCDIKSNEFGWFSRDFTMEGCTVESDYFMLHAGSLAFRDVRFRGKYALQYLHDAVFDHCDITSRDAFWHAHNVTVRNSVLRGEFLGWYSDNLTLEHCRILSSQPLCYCSALKLIDCEVVDSDLCFEKSDVDAVITTPVDSIKNPRSGRIVVPSVDEIIRDDEHSRAEILVAGGRSSGPCMGSRDERIAI